MPEKDRSQWSDKKVTQPSSVIRKGVALTASSFLIMASSYGNIESLNGKPLPIPPDIARMISSGNIKIAINKDGIPLSYVLTDSTVGVFDQEELRQLKQKAIDTKESQIIAIFPLIMDVDVNSFEFKDKFNSGHQEVFNLPEDVLPSDELEKRGVTIIQSDNTNLYIREGAFAKGAPLENFNHTERRLTLVLINGPFVSSIFMKDPRYDRVRHLLEENPRSIAEYKSEKMGVLRAKLDSLRALLEVNNRSSKAEAEKISDIIRQEILQNKVNLFAYERNILIPDQMRELIELEFIRIKLDNFIRTGAYDMGPETISFKEIQGEDGEFDTTIKKQYKSPTIFLAVGKSGSFRKEIIFFNPQGKLGIALQNVGIGASNTDMSPKPGQSYPNPADFVRNPGASPDKPESYLIGGGQSAGFNLHHELGAHDELIAQKLNKGEEPNLSEYDADMEALREIKDAWDIWNESGFTNKSRYNFLFSLTGGGYILTELKPFRAI